MSGVLQIVSTPIGNLEDVSLRALRVLREADLIAAEDTRVTRKLLSRYDVHTPLVSYHEHSGPARTEEIVSTIGDGKRVALVSDAGTPGISDPGHDLIVACVEAGLVVEAIPGASAVITALVLSGMPTTRFIFDGFAPRKDGERRSYFRGLIEEERTVCLYEAPTRLLKTLGSIEAELGERRLSVVREATKLHEEVFRGAAREAREHFSRSNVRGEIVIVIQGAEPGATSEPAESDVAGCLRELLASGMSERDAVKQCALRMKLPKRQVYAVALAMKQGSG